jgi:N-acylneuraminate cytidylyltransferase
MKIKILAIITARKNSKRLPKKNLKKIGNRTLVEWSINCAKNINEIVDIFVTTDDSKILKISKKNGAISPWLRPKYLSKDNTSTEDTVRHVIKWYEKKICKVDGILLLQPTTPFRSKATLKKAIDYFKKKQNKPIISVSKIINDKKFSKLLVNGAFYLSSTKYFKKYNNLSPKNFYSIFIKKKEECIDINTKSDLKLARKYFKKKINQSIYL